MNKIYISYSMQYAHLASEVYDLLEKQGYEVSCWDIGREYSEKPLREADAVVFILNDYNWGCKIPDMTRGTKNEYHICSKIGKPMYIAYKRSSDNQLIIYEADVEFEGSTAVLKGVAGRYLQPVNPYKVSPEDSQVLAELEGINFEYEPKKRRKKHK